MSDIIKCSACGKPVRATDTYCRACHTPISLEKCAPLEELEGIHADDWKEYIGKKSDKYFNIFANQKNKRIFLYPHWQTFIFNPAYWFFYRRMYLVGMIVTLLQCSTMFLLLLPSFSDLFYWLIPTFVGIIISAFSVCIYKAHIKHKLSKPIVNMDAGGTSVKALILGAIFYITVHDVLGALVLLNYFSY